jgi:Tfp pilus assembly protein PilZ
MFKKNGQPNRRHFPRIPLIMTVRFEKQGTDQSDEAVIRTISTNGIGMYTKASLEKGDRLLIHLSLLTDENQLVEESILGDVTWAAPEGGKGRYSVGIYFGEMEKGHPKLHAYIKRLEEAILHSDETWKTD